MNVFCNRSFYPVLTLVCGIAGCAALRADDVTINRFKDASELAGWRFDYGGVTNLIAFDPSQDAANSPTSGCMKVSFGFDAAALGASGNNKGAVTIDFPTALDGSAYLSMEMDLKMAPGSATTGASNSGFFQMVIRNGGNYTFNSQFGANVSTNDGWRHISVPPAGPRDDIRAITLELFGGAGLSGPVTFYVDNLKFTKPSSAIDLYVSRFDNASSANGWLFDYGGVTNLFVFDPSEDASNNPASGSLRITFGFDTTLFGNNVGALTFDLPSPLSGPNLLSLEMDVKVLPGSATDGSGNSGYLQLGLRTAPFYDFEPQIATYLRADDGWRHLRVAPLTGQLDDVRAITLELSGSDSLSGPVTFYIDNLKFTAMAGPPPGPTLLMERPIRGLNFIPSSGQYERQNIGTVNSSGMSWIGAPETVTYSVTIDQYPGAAHSGFQTHLFLVAGAPGIGSSPDYSQPDVVFFDIQSVAGGTAAAAFRYKINEPNGNSFLYGAGTLGLTANPVPVGTWQLTFDHDTNATVTAPGGAIGTFTLPPSAAAHFADPLTLYLGAQANAAGNVGQTVVVSRFRLTRGATTVLDDDFLADEDLNTATWQIAAGTPAGVQLVGASAAFWLDWTTPDSGFVLQSTSDVADPNSWLPIGWTATQMGSLKRILVNTFNANPDPNKNYEPNPTQSFFRMLK